jgi:hypothetical protein
MGGVKEAGADAVFGRAARVASGGRREVRNRCAVKGLRGPLEDDWVALTGKVREGSRQGPRTALPPAFGDPEERRR